jgi:hypothetical protein
MAHAGLANCNHEKKSAKGGSVSENLRPCGPEPRVFCFLGRLRLSGPLAPPFVGDASGVLEVLCVLCPRLHPPGNRR